MVEQNFGNLSVNVDLKIEDAGLKSSLLQSFSSKGIIATQSTSPDLLISQSKGGAQKLKMVTSTDATVGSGEFNVAQQSDFDYISEVVMMYARARYLREMEYYNPDLDLELEIVPVTYKVVDKKYLIDQELDIEDFTNEGGEINFPVGTTFTFRVTNNGRKKAYFNVIHINPLDTIEVFLPFKKQSAEEMALNPRQSITFDKVLQIVSPTGIDMFKVVASSTVLDLRPLVTPTAQRSGGSPFEQLFGNTIRTRDTPYVGTVPPTSFSTHSVVFNVFEP